MTRQEFTDAVAEVIGVNPLREVKVDTIVRLADAYAQTQVGIYAATVEGRTP